MMTLQEAMDHVGSSGRYQYQVFGFFVLGIFIISLQIMSPTYSYIKPKFICEFTDGQPQECEDNILNCNLGDRFRIDPAYKYDTIVTDFDLYCSRSQLISIGASINFLGSVLGGAFLSYLADRKGRKFTFVLSWVMTTFSLIGIYFSFNMLMLMIMNFIFGFFEIGNYILFLVILNEICSTRLRQILSLCILIVWSFAEIVVAVLFYYIHDWRDIQLYFIAIPSLIGLVPCIYFQETPKFYFSKGQNDKAIKVLNYIAKVNHRTPIKDISLETQTISIAEKRIERQFNFIDLFKYKSLRVSSIGFFLISYSLHVVYYAGQYGMKDISQGNMIYIMGITVGVSEMFAYTLTALLVHKLKRKLAIQVSFIFSILGCLVFVSYGFHSYQVICTDCIQEYLTIIVLCFIRIFNTLGFGIQGLYSNEFYPTPVRATGSGFLFSAGIFGSFNAPFIADIGKWWNLNPFLIMSVISVLGSLGTIFTKETKGKPMKDQIEEFQKSQLVTSDMSPSPN